MFVYEARYVQIQDACIREGINDQQPYGGYPMRYVKLRKDHPAPQHCDDHINLEGDRGKIQDHLASNSSLTVGRGYKLVTG